MAAKRPYPGLNNIVGLPTTPRSIGNLVRAVCPKPESLDSLVAHEMLAFNTALLIGQVKLVVVKLVVNI